MITKQEIDRVLLQIEKQVGPCRPFDKQNVAIERGQLAVLIAAARDAAMSGDGHWVSDSYQSRRGHAVPGL